MQQLEVIDHDQADIVAPLEPPGPCAQRRDGKRGRIVDIERKLVQPLTGEAQFLEILAADLAHAQQFAADFSLFGENAGGELIRAHFQAEKCHGGANRFFLRNTILDIAQQPVSGIERDIGGQRRLAHAGPPGQNHQIGLVQSTDLFIDAGQPGGGA